MGTLDDLPAQILRQLVIDLGHGTDPDDSGSWPVFATTEPNTPDNCITVYSTAGRDQGSIHVDPMLIENEGFQIKVRATTNSVGYTKADAIAKGFDAVALRTVILNGNTYVMWGIIRGSILDVGKSVPESRRSIFTINGTLTVEQRS